MSSPSDRAVSDENSENCGPYEPYGDGEYFTLNFREVGEAGGKKPITSDCQQLMSYTLKNTTSATSPVSSSVLRCPHLAEAHQQGLTLA